MSNEDNTKHVNVIVNSDSWEALEDENRSEIVRNALDSHADMQSENQRVNKFANEYENLRKEIEEKETEKRVKKELLFKTLNNHDFDSLIDEEFDDAAGNEFEETIVFASNYAEEYLNDGVDPDKVKKKIIRDMKNENRKLRYPIAEWIVAQLAEDE